MGGESPVVELYDSNGNPLSVQNATAIPASTPGVMVLGSDGTNSRYLLVDSSGNQIMVGAGTAGSPSGGVVSIQGVASGTAVPISGSVTISSGTITANQGTSPWVTNVSQFGGNNVVTGTGTSGVGIPRVTVSNDSNILATQSGSWTVTSNQGTPNSLANKWPVQITDGTNTMPTGDAITRAIYEKITDGTNTAAVTASSALKIDGSAVIQPVSGTVTANQGTAASLSGYWPVRVTDGTNTMPTGDAVGRAIFEKITDGTNTAAVKAASTAAVAADPSLVIAFSPNSPLPTGSNTIGAVTQASGPWTANVTQFGSNNVVTGTGASGSGIPRVTVSNDSNILATQSGTWTVAQGAPNTLANKWPVQITDGTNTMPTADVASRAQFDKITDGTNTAAVKAASTAAAAADPSLVVGLSPNSPLPAGTNTIGIVNQGTAASLANAWSTKITDGTNGPVTVKPSGTTPLTTDPALVVSVSPNSSTTITGSEIMSGSYPDPSSIDTGSTGPDFQDQFGNLQTRGPVFTDEGSFRDDFTGSSLTTSLSGTVTFTNNSTTITGSGTSFTTQVIAGQFIKKSADSETLYQQVASVNSDTSITLASVYTGTTASTTAVVSNWQTSTPSGGSITVASSAVTLAPGTTNGNVVQITRSGDYLPLTLNIRASISQRIANQTTILGFQDNPAGFSQEAIIVFDGTSSSTIKFRTSASSAAADLQETVIQLASGLDTSQTLFYEIDVTPDTCFLSVNGTVVAIHANHMPGPYTNMSLVANVTNSAAVTATNFNIDLVYFQDTDVVTIHNTFNASPIQVQTVVDQALTGISFGQANTGGSANTLAALNATTYTEQTTAAQRSVKSSSANDTSAGTGARTIKIIYYDASVNGPFVETITLNGTTAVNTANSNICFIEKMEVLTVGSTKTNQGTISIFTTTAGGGSAFGSIGVGNTVSAGTVGDNTTLWAHHYVASGRTCQITTMSGGTTGNQSGFEFLRVVDPTNTVAAEKQITDTIAVVSASGSGSIFRVAGIPIRINGPARIQQYAVSNGTNTVFLGGFEFAES